MIAHLIGVVDSHPKNLSLPWLEAGSMGHNSLNPIDRTGSTTLSLLSYLCRGTLLHHGSLVRLASRDALHTTQVFLFVTHLGLKVFAHHAWASANVVFLHATVRMVLAVLTRGHHCNTHLLLDSMSDAPSCGRGQIVL